MKVSKGDTVQVIAGADIGHRGQVLRVFPKRERAIVEGANFIKRHTKARRTGEQSGIVEKEAPVHLSNLMVVCPKCDAPVRVKRRALEGGSRVRVCGKCKEMLSVA
ncbi:MAG: 50S ribosomal protein L24 [Candidatus Latescibacteria bacterium]|nr:50S ribosomal protein L24 [Candidatus Latescibacterota bacterium]MCK5327941.1 50S ribosomal protein L24 [Candidatus Latescibacterota bacterium]MCK5381447.1 50S ribosomal protein L24 [Candidatus Latescibacterota bacterium]MCK5525517.1 50S ribosomal protein L24 [Candidatus Latescibacterota bacterium]MCK5733104.1 50S ribosomal protein L24 [Candidatus Latescibacterota bacterium]